MFVSEEKLDVTQISLTGTRALALIGLLIVAPYSFEEVKKKFIELGLFDEKSSDDILRIDIGTIKTMGCEISRPCASNGYKYVMQKHPFSLVLTLDDVKLLKRAYSKIKDNLSLEILIEYDDLFRKIADFVYEEEIKEALLGISFLKYYDVNEIKELYSDCNSQKIIELVYKNQEIKKESLKKIKAQALVFKNDKIYLHGYDFEKKESTVLLYKRIKKIISKEFDDEILKQKNITITYQLKNVDEKVFWDNEKIVEKKEKNYIVQGSFYNEFLATQRILSFGAKCVVISPLEFRDSIINKLKEMKEVYNG